MTDCDPGRTPYEKPVFGKPMKKTNKAARSVPPAENQSHFAEPTPPAEETTQTPPPEAYEQQMLYPELPPMRYNPLSEGKKKRKRNTVTAVPKDIWNQKL